MGAIAGVVLVGALFTASPVAAATSYGTNLVKNGGAENGLTGWETFPSGDFQVRTYGPAGFGFPAKSQSTKIGGGTHFFYAGTYDNVYGTCADAAETFTLTGIGTAIDTGHVAVRLRGYVATNGAANVRGHRAARLICRGRLALLGVAALFRGATAGLPGHLLFVS